MGRVEHSVASQATHGQCLSCGEFLNADKDEKFSLPHTGHDPYARGTRPWQELQAFIVRMLSEMHAGSTEATAGEEKSISVRIEVIYQDIYFPHVQV